MKNLIGFLFVSLFILTSFTIGNNLNANASDNLLSSEEITALSVDAELSKLDLDNLSDEDILNLSPEALVVVYNRGCMTACWNAYLDCISGGFGNCFSNLADCMTACNDPSN